MPSMLMGTRPREPGAGLLIGVGFCDSAIFFAAGLGVSVSPGAGDVRHVGGFSHHGQPQPSRIENALSSGNTSRHCRRVCASVSPRAMVRCAQGRVPHLSKGGKMPLRLLRCARHSRGLPLAVCCAVWPPDGSGADEGAPPPSPSVTSSGAGPVTAARRSPPSCAGVARRWPCFHEETEARQAGGQRRKEQHARRALATSPRSLPPSPVGCFSLRSARHRPPRPPQER
jgi:hypothetical protein